MTPDSPESRLGRLETSVAKLEQRADEHERDLRAFAPMTASHAVLTEQIVNLQKQQVTILTRLDAQDAAREAERRERDAERLQEQKEREQGQERIRKERKTDRQWVVATIVASAMVIIAAFGVIQGLV